MAPDVQKPKAPVRNELHPPEKVAIFIHGAGGGGWEWDAWTPIFEKAGWKCIAEDLQPSKGGIGQTRFVDYLAQVEHKAKSQQPRSVILIGASMGGILALKAGENIKPDAIVLANSVGPKGVGNPNPKNYPKVVEWSKGTLQETREAMPDSDEAIIQFAFRHWRDESGAVLNEISQGIEVKPPPCPTLIVVGDQDTDVPPSTGREIAKKFNAQLMEFKGMSHVGPLLGIRAPEVATSVLEWLEENIR
jgi:pimeloyl-ACP methyl ester carboxylesterase